MSEPLWNIRGVDAGHRAMAKTAAKAAGCTLGEWVCEAIERAAEMQELSRKTIVAEVIQGEPTGMEIRDDLVSGETSGLAPEQPQAIVRAKKVRDRDMCAHGTVVGFNCWRCGGKAEAAK